MPQISAATTLASDTVDLVGVEPTTSSLQEKHSPIGTTDPQKARVAGLKPTTSRVET